MKRSFFSGFPLVLVLALLLHTSCSVSKSEGEGDKATTQWFEGKQWLNGLQLKPHKSIDRQEFKRQYEANRDAWDKAFAFLKGTDLAALKPGRLPIDGDKIYALVTEGTGKDIEKAAWEGHQQYIDIHYVVSGKEKIGLAPIDKATLTTPYDPARDIAFYSANGNFYEADTETFFIAFPHNLHAPGIRVEGQGTIKKVVVKVKRSE